MSFFLGNAGTALRTQYTSLTFTDVASATNQATAAQIAYLGRGARFAYFDNTLNADMSIWLMSPDYSDQTSAAGRIFFLELPQNRVLNFDFLQQVQVEFDPGTKIFVSIAPGSSAPTSGKLRLTTFA